jgi:hypothetical protein
MISGKMGLFAGAVLALGVAGTSEAAIIAAADFQPSGTVETGFTAQGVNSQAYGTTTLTVSGASGFFERGPAVPDNGAMTFGALYSEFVFNNSPTGFTITMDNLSPTSAYDLRVYSYDKGVSGAKTTTVTPANGTVGTPGVINYVGGTDPTTNDEYSALLTLTPNASGVITVNVTGSAEVRVNGLVLQDSAIPEPASLGLLSIGALGLLARRRKA